MVSSEGRDIRERNVPVVGAVLGTSILSWGIWDIVPRSSDRGSVAREIGPTLTSSPTVRNAAGINKKCIE